MDRMLSPPSAKKSSSGPTSGRPRTPATAAQSSRSRSLAGARAAARETSGAGRAARSILPLGVRGSASRVTNADGTIGSGSAPASPARSAPVSSGPAGTT
ncbi:hypothetical protein Psuf_088290 [Phytohabitans suffuscus]|uniref:Uncharacterized protein n=1 Tax=Phytohabitans suffuscus TaxID=624315 RepID=A0A6F8YZM5_9ACTN|nr:hypothetical protein Psuf_088290 [Phytohabitans suffuscus]